MFNQPNLKQGPQLPFSSPPKVNVFIYRRAAGLTQAQAASLVHASLRAWQQWERGDRRMHAGLWELFLIKTDFKITYEYLSGGDSN
jgi:DNA-binding XRE family transcriptional regulator